MGEKLRHSYPWYVADWLLSDARRTLNLSERGLYRELLDYLYTGRDLPCTGLFDATPPTETCRSFAKVASCTVREFTTSWPQVRRFFAEKDGLLVHRKVSEVLEKLSTLDKNTSAKGRAAANARWHKSGNATSNAGGISTDALRARVLPLPHPLPLPPPASPAPAATPVPSGLDVESETVFRTDQVSGDPNSSQDSTGVQEQSFETSANGAAVAIAGAAPPLKKNTKSRELSRIEYELWQKEQEQKGRIV